MRTALLFALFLSAGAGLAQAWNLTDCDTKDTPAWATFEQKVRSAKPGSTLYVPHPYPQTDAAVVADFVYQFQDIWRDTALSDVPPDERRLLEGIAGDRVATQVVRVENWSLTRCGGKQRRAYYHLLRIMDGDTGAELGRAALNDTGLLSRWTLFPLNAEEAQRLARLGAPRLSEAAERIARTFGLPVHGAQYVHSTGTIRCNLLSPCVAFKSRGQAFLHGPVSDPDGLYRIKEGRPLLSFQRDLAAPAKKTAVERGLGAGQRVVSLGGDAFTVATRVEPKP